MKKRIMAVPAVCFWIVITVCLVGILIGSFFDLSISQKLANTNDIGKYFAAFSPFVSYCMYPAAGSCLYVGLCKKREQFRPLAKLLLFLSWFLPVCYSNDYFGKHIRQMFGYVPGESSVILSVLSWLVWAVLYGWVPFAVIRLLDDTDPDKLILIGAAILVSALVTDAVMQWLKQVGSRPRYKYLITLEDPSSEFRQWWQMIPNLAGTDDSYQSWPSGHMTLAGSLFMLPLVTDCMKQRSLRKNVIAFCLVCVFMLICAYNRIHMTSHFLSDVCFGTLITYLEITGICTVFTQALDKTKY